MLAMSPPMAGNHNDLYEIEEVLKEILAFLEEAGIEHKGLFLNADGGLGIKHLRLGDRGDSYRTAALNVSVGDFSAGFNLFTGKRIYSRPEDYSYYPKNLVVDDFNVKFPRGYVDEIGKKCRLGSLTFGYGDYRAGVNSEKVRHAIQDRAIHGIIKDAGFENQSWQWNSYYHIRTRNRFTSW